MAEAVSLYVWIIVVTVVWFLIVASILGVAQWCDHRDFVAEQTRLRAKQARQIAYIEQLVERSRELNAEIHELCYRGRR